MIKLAEIFGDLVTFGVRSFIVMLFQNSSLLPDYKIVTDCT